MSGARPSLPVDDRREFFDGEQWTLEAVAAWLASLFESAGRLDVRKTSVTLTLEGRDPNVLRAVNQHLECGEVSERLGGRSVASPYRRTCDTSFASWSRT